MEATLLDSYGCLNVVANSIGRLTIKILDTNGTLAKKMYRDIMEGVHRLDINLNELSAGTYILNAFNGDQFLRSFRFEKQ